MHMKRSDDPFARRLPSDRPIKLEQQQTYWEPPTGWVQTDYGVWVPNDYKPTRWELPSPRVRNYEEARAEWIKCQKSLTYFAFYYVWTLDVDDPTGQGVRKVPVYPYLRKFFMEVQEIQNTHVEKSRQMLLSWAWMVVFLWDALFKHRYAGLVLSKRSRDVDDGGINSTPNSNLGKIRFMHDRLPEHLWTPFEFKKFIVRVPANDSTITGETGKGGKASRGPAYNRALMDEAAYVERSETVFSGLRQAAKKGTILNSTPKGMGNTFARIRFSKTTTFKRLSFHWSEHPRKAIGLYCVCGWKATPGKGKTPREQFDEHSGQCPRLAMVPPRPPIMRSPWYDREVADMTPDTVASELDISYEASQAGRVYTQFNQSRNVWPIYHKIGPRLDYENEDEYRARYLRQALDPHLPTFTCWDIGVGDPCSLILGQEVDPNVPIIRYVDEFEAADQSYETYSSIVNTVWRPALEYIGNTYTMRHYGGYDFKNRDSKLESWFLNLKRESPPILVETRSDPKDLAKGGSLLEWLDYINWLYGLGHIQVSEWCKHTIDCVSNYHFPLNEDGTPLPGTHLPVHDWSSHNCDAQRHYFRVRFRHKLNDRKAREVKAHRILARGSNYDIKTEARKF